jgi:imidazolonepropionase-like amidohydrolase
VRGARLLPALLALLLGGGRALADGEGAGGAPAPARVRPGDGVLALVGGDVYTVSGAVYRRGTILVRDGKIWKAGVDLALPEGARVLDVSGKRVLPGYVAADADAIGLVAGGVRPGSKYADCLDPYSRLNEIALGSGITALYNTAGNRGFWTSQTAVLRPAAGDAARMVLRENAAVWVNWARGSATDRMQFEELLRTGARHLKEAEEARRAGREPPRPPGPPEILAALRREIPVRVPAVRKEEILDALRLAETFGVRMVIEDALEAWLVAEPLARLGAVSVVTPRNKSRDYRRVEPNGGNIGVAGILERAGARFCLEPPGGPGTVGGGLTMGGLAGRDLMNLPIEGCFAVRGGASEAETLRSMTLGAAEALGVADRIGSIDPGKDADLIVLDGDPFHYCTMVDMAMIEGKVLYERGKSNLFKDLPGR